ncbi:hypothetical protein DAI22_07g060200 [Oryza sativa Japonica Group]|nr:hypothetical protein DAI22_07g060200 [Oryza sativa Japonica Group]
MRFWIANSECSGGRFKPRRRTVAAPTATSVIRRPRWSLALAAGLPPPPPPPPDTPISLPDTTVLPRIARGHRHRLHLLSASPPRRLPSPAAAASVLLPSAAGAAAKIPHRARATYSLSLSTSLPHCWHQRPLLPWLLVSTPPAAAPKSKASRRLAPLALARPHTISTLLNAAASPAPATEALYCIADLRSTAATQMEALEALPRLCPSPSPAHPR